MEMKLFHHLAPIETTVQYPTDLLEGNPLAA
jgi:hypothetical protein